MAYDRAMDIVRLAIRLQGTGNGLTLDDMQREFEISRRTAERLRNAVEELFGPLVTVPTGEPKRRCRLRAPILRRLITLSAEELAELPAAAMALDRAGLEERALMLRRLDDKLRALLEAETLDGIEPDLQALTEAEGLAMRPGPRPRLEDGLLAVLRQAVKTGRIVADRGLRLRVAFNGTAHPAARRALRPDLRQPRVPGRPRRTRSRDAAVAPGTHERRRSHRRTVHARFRVRPAALHPAFVWYFPGTAA